MIVWHNGYLLPEEDVALSPQDRGFTLADGIFETIPVWKGAPYLQDDHLRRLEASLIVLALPQIASLSEAITAVIKANHIQHGVLRLTVSRGQGARGLTPPYDPTPTVIIWPSHFVSPPVSARVHIAQQTRRNQHSPLSRIKSLNYGDNLLARMEATTHNADEAILLNAADRVACATVANIFAIFPDGIKTPPVSEGALPGIMRAQILQMGVAIETPLQVEDLRNSQGLFLTNSLGFTSVVALDGIALPINTELQKIKTLWPWI